MAWNEQRAIQRIQQHMKTAPTVDRNVSLAEQRRLMREEIAKASAQGRFPNARAVEVEGAHLYGQLLDFESLVADGGRGETEGSHKKVLQFLDTHYQVWDSIVDGDDAIRVDFHGPRLHAVIVGGKPHEQISRAVALAAKLQEVGHRVASAHGFPSATRFGIDQGRCLALTTGRSHDTDTLFLGAPANHAAKVAVAENVGGIYLTQNAQRIIGQSLTPQDVAVARQDIVDDAKARFPFSYVDAAAQRITKAAGTERKQFTFFRPTPPLSGLKFRDLSAARTARMGMASIFADIDGYTAFVDAAIKSGGSAILTAVKGIHVIREELNDVLKEDFGGKRVRFIGDCIHGLVAKGEREDDHGGTVLDAALCASGMKSSFDLCLQMIPGLNYLDLAVGVEYGMVPLTRIGLRGDDSVRCAAGRAVIVSERVQQSIEGGGIKLGDAAFSVANQDVRKHFGKATRILGYDDAVELLSTIASPIAQIMKEVPTARPYLDR